MDFKLTSEIIVQLEANEIEVVKYMENLGILKLKTAKELTSEDLEFITHLEVEEQMRAIDDSE